MNKTLFSCGLKKVVEKRTGRKYDVTSSHEQNAKLKTRNIPCKFCQAIFTPEQYLNTQIQFQHKSQTSDVIPTMLPKLAAFKDQEKTRNGTNLVRDEEF